MRARWIAAVVLVGCGGLPPPERLPNRGIPNHPVPETPRAETPRWETDDEVRALWHAFRIDGASYSAQLEGIPTEYRARMASVLLRDGGLRCETVVTKDGCVMHEALAKPDPSESIDDACLRRYVALWAVDQIADADTAATLTEALLALVKLPPPEEELGEKALAKLVTTGTAQYALWEADAAGNRGLLERHLDLLDQAALVAAATDRHVDGAVLRLLPDAAAEDRLLRLAAVDARLQLTTRIAVITRIVEVAQGATGEVRTDLVDRLLVLANDADCSLAGAAEGALFALGEHGALPSGPFRSAEAVVHAACATLGAVGASGAAWKQILAPGTIGTPIPFADELRLALPHCDDGLDCAIPGTSVHFQLDIRRARGTRYRLHAIGRHERVGSDC